jgi:hypothetical protein
MRTVCGAALSNQIVCGVQENRLPAPQMIFSPRHSLHTFQILSRKLRLVFLHQFVTVVS